MNRITICKRIEWDAAHRVLRHESKCATLHGHRYAAEIACSADALDDLGRVIDFGVIKEVVGKWIDDNWDHNTLLNRDDLELIGICMRDAELRGRSTSGSPRSILLSWLMMNRESRSMSGPRRSSPSC